MTTVDVACGTDPRGDVNLDVRPTPDVDVRADVRALPLADGAAEEIVAVDVLEHVRWDDVPVVLEECHRTLEPGGTLWVRTPDFAWICENHGSIAPMRLQRKLYGGATSPMGPAEGYEANYHRSIFHPRLLEELLDDVGFVDVVVNTDLPAPNHWNMAARAVVPTA